MTGTARRSRRVGLAVTAAAVLLIHSAVAPAVFATPLPHLRWLARNQQSDGSWGGTTSPPATRTRLTGLALLNFLGAGYTHLSRDQYDGIVFGQTVKRGLLYLMKKQDAEERATASNEVLDARLWGALALTEAYGLTASALLKEGASKAVAWIERAQRPGGGWGSGDTEDPLLTAQGLLLMHSAKIGGVTIPDALETGAANVLERLEARKLPAEASAAVLASMLLLNRRKDLPALRKRADQVVRALSGPEPASPALRHWGLLSLYHYDGPAGLYYKHSNEAVKQQIVTVQRRADDGELAGSWDPPEADEFRTVAPPKSVPPEVRQRAEELIAQLADEEWAVRDRATAELLRLGPDAFPLVMEATTHSDPELALRATQVAQALAVPCGDDRRIETTCLNGLTLEVYYRYQNVFGMATR